MTLRSAVALIAVVLTPLVARASQTDSDVAVVPFEGLGVEPTVVEKVAEALRAQVGKRHFTVLGAEQTRSRQRAAAMCGEDVECLATLGQRLEAQYVVAFGLGKVGDGAMFTSLVVDVAKSKKVQEYSERLPGFPADPEPMALRAVSTLFVDLTPGAKLTPKEQPPGLAATQTGYKLRPYAYGFTAGAGAFAIAGAVLTVMAQQSFSKLPEVKPSDRPGADSSQRTLNLAADITMSVAGVAAVVALVLFLIDGPAEAPR
ncbi:MAG: hypothetical protein QM723_10570 [Myxococcaceae bacterium]